MKFIGIEKVHQGKYLTRYNVEYEAKSGKHKFYEIVSRKKDLQKFEDLHDENSDAVILVMHDKTGQKILLNHEFRMAPGELVYNFPAGLIDSGENVEQAGKRELWEETGLDLIEVKEVWKESYSAVGFSDEKTVVLVGVADGEMKESTSEMEEIDARWFTKAEIRELLKSSRFAARTQAYCVLWSRE
ncbi:MAG: NUDIX hydrolase [Treponema sp.]|nr:NUDIX hydrolase [Treponema sp.]